MITEIYKLESLDELHEFINLKTADVLRPKLLQEFEKFIDYKNISDWNQLVRICEALRITNWGELEPYEAIASKWINGSYYSWLQNKFFEQKNNSHKGWNKQGNSFVIDELDNDKTDYSITTLKTQRNKLPKAPIRFTRSGNYQKSLQPLIDKLDHLKELLIKETKPELYGDTFSYIGLNLSFSNHDDDYETVRAEYYHKEEDVPKELLLHKEGIPQYYIRPRLKISNLSTKENELRLLVTRHFPKAFGYYNFEEQKAILLEDILEIIETLQIKLKKKKLPYHTDLLRKDIIQIFSLWK